jgi:hypothetical protein
MDHKAHTSEATPGKKAYDVYGRELNPLNNMAVDATPGQLPGSPSPPK